MHASSRGAGDVFRAALDAGARRLVLGIGGSASTDRGAGLLQALGAEVLDCRGAAIGPGGVGLADVAELRLGGLHPRLRDAELVVASDVTNPLYGPIGAAAVYAPQKGADPAQVAALDAGLRRWAGVAATATGRDRSAEPGAGAAGGVGFAALLLGAALRPGIEVVLELMGFPQQLAAADLVITGEGSLDGQTLSGKAPAGVAAAAGRAGVPVLAVAGRVALDREQLAVAGFSGASALQDLEPDLARSVREAGPLLERATAAAVREWLHAG
jgi:glycerate kinase